VRGDGLTFVFRLDGEASVVYRWTRASQKKGEGEEEGEGGGGSMVSSASPGSERTEEVDSTSDQFLVAAHDYLSVGGGRALGSNALRIDADLASCFAGPSDTFSNPPLAPEESIQPFAIGE
jgi:hypothetical protein